MMTTSKPIGISLPKDIIKKIDIERQDIPRSKYLLRIIEKLYQKKETKKTNDSLDSSSLKQVSSESITGGQ